MTRSWYIESLGLFIMLGIGKKGKKGPGDSPLPWGIFFPRREALIPGAEGLTLGDNTGGTQLGN